MSRVAVVTDTTGYLPGELVRAHGIHLVSLYVNFGGERTVREADITDYDRFYEELRDADALPTTSQPAVGDFLAVYEPLLEDGCDIISIHISAGLSGTCGAAHGASVEEVALHLFVLDVRERLLRRALRADGHAELVAAPGQLPGHVRADESSGAGDERLGHAGSLWGGCARPREAD